MTRKEKRKEADIKRLIYKHLISKALDDSISKAVLKLNYPKDHCINEVLYRFPKFIEIFCKKNPQEAHMIRQAASLYKKDLEALNENKI